TLTALVGAFGDWDTGAKVAATPGVALATAKETMIAVKVTSALTVAAQSTVIVFPPLPTLAAPESWTGAGPFRFSRVTVGGVIVPDTSEAARHMASTRIAWVENAGLYFTWKRCPAGGWNRSCTVSPWRIVAVKPELVQVPTTPPPQENATLSAV